jgi:TonB family protein
MFAQLNPSVSTKRRTALAVSLVLHGLLFAWLLHTPEPQLLMPTAVAIGHNGKVVTQLYWPSRSPDDSDTSSADSATQLYRHQRLAHDKLTWKKTASIAKLPSLPLPPQHAPSQDDAKTTTLSKLGHGAPAGLPYGSVPGGPVYGNEVRPALPITTADPVAYPWELPAGDGRVVVEITIDERGEIVRKKVLESLGPKLDEKVLDALNNWHFQPATQNGVAIPSKQDAIFHFHAHV